jgi:serine/threonine-protein phosphatase 2A regulatory subunit B
MWNLEITNQSFNIVDIKPDNMEELTEVITSASFHPKQVQFYIYSLFLLHSSFFITSLSFVD